MKNFYYYPPLIFQKVAYIVFYIIYRAVVGIEIVGKENLRGIKGPLIIAANHTHEADVTIAPLIVGFFSKLYPIYFVANPKGKIETTSTWKKYLYGGLFFNFLGGYPIHPGYQDYSHSLEKHLELLRQGRTVLIFPEGKRTLDGKLNPARGGLGYMVYTTKAAVLPVVIDTFFNITILNSLTSRRKIKITILKPISANELMTTQIPGVEDFRLASQVVMDRIREKL